MNVDPVRRDIRAVGRQEHWEAWPVSWSGVWVGALAALASALIIGLIAIALGAHQLAPGQDGAAATTLGLVALFFSVFGAFFAFVAGGWIAGRIAGFRRAEPAMLHGAIVWLVAVPLLLLLAALGAGNYFGGWFGGLAGTPAWAVAPGAAVDANTAAAARNAALGALTALLLGLVGSVLGGWLASGEPMSLTHYRTREHPTDRPSAIAS